MPLHKDEQLDNGADTRASRRDRTKGTGSQARQPRNLPPRDEDPHKDFYSDEHPEIPKIRRASRDYDSHPSSSRYPATRASEIETEYSRHVSPSQRQKSSYEGQKQYAKPMSQ